MKTKLVTNKDPEQFQKDLQNAVDEAWYISGELSTTSVAGFVVYTILLIKK